MEPLHTRSRPTPRAAQDAAGALEQLHVAFRDASATAWRPVALSEPFLASLRLGFPTVAGTSAGARWGSDVAAWLAQLHRSPSAVCWRKGGVQLLRFRALPLAQRALAPPLLIVGAPMNTSAILDMAPGRSVVRQFLRGGFDVFLLEWGEPGERQPTLEDHLLSLREAVGAVRFAAGSAKVSLLGYSWGGVLALIHAATQSDVASLLLHSTPVDGSRDDSVMAHWLRALPLGSTAPAVRRMPGALLSAAFFMRNPLGTAGDAPLYTALMADDASRWALNLVRIWGWICSVQDVPMPLFRRFAVDLYRENKLVRGLLELGPQGIAVQLGRVRVPLLCIVGRGDDLVPAPASVAVERYVASRETETLAIDADHVSLCVGLRAHTDAWPRAVSWLRENARGERLSA